jgi:hypothetical protein
MLRNRRRVHDRVFDQSKHQSTRVIVALVLGLLGLGAVVKGLGGVATGEISYSMRTRGAPARWSPPVTLTGAAARYFGASLIAFGAGSLIGAGLAWHGPARLPGLASSPPKVLAGLAAILLLILAGVAAMAKAIFFT